MPTEKDPTSIRFSLAVDEKETLDEDIHKIDTCECSKCAHNRKTEVVVAHLISDKSLCVASECVLSPLEKEQIAMLYAHIEHGTLGVFRARRGTTSVIALTINTADGGGIPLATLTSTEDLEGALKRVHPPGKEQN